MIAAAHERRGLPADFRVADLETFFAVRRCGSVTGAARTLGVSPSHVSKAIARLESQLQVVLLSRGAHGVALTDEALRLLPELERAIAHLERAFKGEHDEARVLACAGPSFLVSLFLPAIARALPHA